MTNQTEALAELRAHCLAAIEHVGSHNSAEREREAKQAVRDRFSEVIAALSSQPPAPRAGAFTDEEWQEIADEAGTIIWASLKRAIDAKLEARATSDTGSTS